MPANQKPAIITYHNNSDPDTEVIFLRVRNLECLNKFSALIAMQHIDVALLIVLVTRYCITQDYCATSHL